MSVANVSWKCGKLIKTLAQFYVRLKRLSLLPAPNAFNEE